MSHLTPMTHPARLAELRAEVDAEARARWETMSGRPWSESERITYDVQGAEYGRSRAVEARAKLHFHRLEQAVREASRWLATVEPSEGAHAASGLVLALPTLRGTLDAAKREAVASGAAAFTAKPPSRATFVRDELEAVAVQQGLPSPLHLDVSTVVIFTLLARFWPFSPFADRHFPETGYPSIRHVFAEEAERCRKFLRRPTVERISTGPHLSAATSD